MGRIRALEIEQRAGVLDSEKQGGKEENGNLIVRSKGLGTFIHSTNLCDASEQGPRCPLGNSSGKSEYHVASVQVIQVPECACASLGGQERMESGERPNRGDSLAEAGRTSRS